MLAVAPMAFAKHDESQAVSEYSPFWPRKTLPANSSVVVHLGRALCGHDGIIHGGLLATVFDESLARNVSLKYFISLAEAS